MAPAGCSGRRQFDVACGVLSRCVKAEATAGMLAAAAAVHAPTTAPAPAPTMVLMPGADVAPDVREELEATPPPPAALAKLTIMYGGRVLLFDDFPAGRVAELVRVAEQPELPGWTTTADIPVTRTASLQRFMEKRRDRLVARAPYAARPASPSPASSNSKKRSVDERDAG